jgi:ankyrin repeat protein
MAMLILCIYFLYYSIKHYGRQMEFAAAQRGDLLSLKIYLLLNPGMLRSIDFDGNSLLHCAVRDGHYDMAEYLLARGIGANCTDRKSRTSLHLAAGNGKDNLVKLLLSRGASQSLLDYEGYTPLHRAVEGNHLSTIRLLAGNGEWKEIKLPPRPGSGTPTPLALAVRKNNVAAARLLLDCGFNVNEPYDNGITPLYCATRFAGREMTELLVQRGADLHNHPMIGRRYDLLLAAADSDNVSVAALLIDKGVDVNERDGRLQTPLHYACRNASPSMISLLIERGAEVNARDSKGDTPLHIAACRKSGVPVEMLIRKGATVNEKNAMGVTPLYYAAKYHALEAAELLIAARSNIDAKDRNGRTPLTQAISEDDLPMLKLFVEHGADLSVLDKCRFRSLNRHKGNISFEMEEYLIDKGVRFKP